MLSIPVQAITSIVFESIILSPTEDTVNAQHRLFLKTGANSKATSKKKSKKLAKINPADSSQVSNTGNDIDSNDIDSESKYDSSGISSTIESKYDSSGTSSTSESKYDSSGTSSTTPTKNTILVSYDFIKKRSKVLKHCLTVLQQQRQQQRRQEQQMAMVSPITIFTITIITTITTTRMTIVELSTIVNPTLPDDSR